MTLSTIVMQAASASRKSNLKITALRAQNKNKIIWLRNSNCYLMMQVAVFASVCWIFQKTKRHLWKATDDHIVFILQIEFNASLWGEDDKKELLSGKEPDT